MQVLKVLLDVLGEPSYTVLQLSADELREKLLLTNRTLEVSVRSIMRASKDELLDLYGEFVRGIREGEQGRIRGIIVVWQLGNCTISFNGLQLRVRSCTLNDKLLKVLDILKGSTIKGEVTL